MAVEPKLMTAAELERLPRDGRRYELVRGELRTMPPAGFEHSDLTLVFAWSLASHVRLKGLARYLRAILAFG